MKAILYALGFIVIVIFTWMLLDAKDMRNYDRCLRDGISPPMCAHLYPSAVR